MRHLSILFTIITCISKKDILNYTAKLHFNRVHVLSLVDISHIKDLAIVPSSYLLIRFGWLLLDTPKSSSVFLAKYFNQFFVIISEKLVSLYSSMVLPQ